MRQRVLRGIFLLGVMSFSLETGYSSFQAEQQQQDGSSTALKPLPLYDWVNHLVMPSTPENGQGWQVLHFSSNKFRPYQNDPAALQFVKDYCQQAKPFETDADTLRSASDSVTLSKGLYLEMGTGSGRTANALGFLNPTKTIYTFDSFEGLSEDWQKGSRTIAQGTFAFKDPNFVPPVLSNVKIYKGWFKDVLPLFKQQILKDQPIAFLNMDADLYSASKDVFAALGENIGPGTVIHFDECYNYPLYKEGEWKAFQEFTAARNLGFDVIGFNAVHEQVVIKIR